MKRLPDIDEFNKNAAYTLLELLIVLSITGLMMSIVVYGVIRFRQTIAVSNATKELVLHIRKARRYAINNVVTSEGYSPTAYYINVSGNDYKWGECSNTGGCSAPKSVKSTQYNGVEVSECKSGSNSFSILKFNHVTGEFIISNDKNQIDPTTDITCIIELKIYGLVNTTREIEVSSSNRTIKIL